MTGSGAVRISAMIAGFAVGVQLARGLGVSGYGYYGLALAIVTLAAIPAEMGLPRLVTREVAAAAARDDLPHLFGVLRWANATGLWISAVMGIAVIIGVLLFVQGGLSGLKLTVLLGTPLIPLLALARIRGGALQGLHHIALGQIPANLIRPVLLSLLLFLVLALGERIAPSGAMALHSLAAAAAFLVAHLWLRQRLPKAAPPEVIKAGRRWIASSVPMALADGMRVLQSELSILLLGLITTAAEVGLFRVAAATAFAAATPISIINHVAFPVTARLHAQGDSVRLQKAVTRFSQAQFAGVLILALPLVLAAGPLVELVFGASYAGSADALGVLAAGQVINAAFGPNAALLNMTRHERRVTRAMTVALILNVILVVAFSALWGGTGAAFAVTAALLCWNVMLWIDARRLLAIDTFIFPLGRSR